VKRRSWITTSILAALGLSVSLAIAQWDPFEEDYGRRGRRGRRGSAENEYQTGKFTAPRDRNGVPTWEKDPEFKHDVFTFVRIAYASWRDRGWGREKWKTDYPDSDLNFSYRLAELTSMKVDPDGKILKLTDPELFDYPFIYIIEPGDMTLDEDEVAALRRYLLNGGFLMVDDFWGEREYETLYGEMKRVFPDREPQELPLEHEIFHCVYDLKVKPQVPSINHFLSGETTERWDATEAHYKAIFDDKDRMMVIICHNTDLGDGWEREGVNSDYFREYSEKYAYPMGINIVTYAMTH
jgi:hypothetical protein